MKKFRMMLPVLAVVFAVVGAIGGNLLPSINGYYKTGATTCSSPAQPVDQPTCSENTDLPNPVCTITVNGIPHQAFLNSDCTGILRYKLPQ